MGRSVPIQTSARQPMHVGIFYEISKHWTPCFRLTA